MAKLQNIIWKNIVWKIVFLFFIEYTICFCQTFPGITYLSLLENGPLRMLFISLFIVPVILYYTIKVKEYCWSSPAIMRFSSIQKMLENIYWTLIKFLAPYYFLLFLLIAVIDIFFVGNIHKVPYSIFLYVVAFTIVYLLFSIAVIELFMLLLNIINNVAFASGMVVALFLAPTILKEFTFLYKIPDWFYFLSLGGSKYPFLWYQVIGQVIIMFVIVLVLGYISAKLLKHKDNVFVMTDIH